MSVGERIKQVRKEAGLTLRAFGAQIGISNGSVSQIEHGVINPSAQTIKSICREFRINETWLRTGEGEKDVASPAFSLDEYARQYGVSELETEFIRLYLELPADTRRTIIDHFRTGLSRLAPAEPDFPDTDEEVLAEFGRQREDEEKIPWTGHQPVGGADAG